MKEKIEKLLYIFFTIFLSVILLLEILLILQIVFSKEKVPTIFGYKPVIVLTDIMEDEIGYGDLILIKETDTNTLEKGDIITYWYGSNTLITDRIVDIEDSSQGTFYITKGDNNENIDNYETASGQVEGKYQFSIKGLGNILIYLSDIKNIFKMITITIVFGIIWIAVGDLLERRKRYKAD